MLIEMHTKLSPTFQVKAHYQEVKPDHGPLMGICVLLTALPTLEIFRADQPLATF